MGFLNLFIMKKVFLILGLSLSLFSCYDFNREQDQKDAESKGKSILLEAESSKKAMIEEAKAKSESAILAAQSRLKVAELDAQSKLTNSEAEAKAIQKISSVLSGNPEYIKYIQVQNLKGNKGEKYFIPTEANVPLLMK